MATLSMGHITREIFGSPEYRWFLVRRIWNAAERARTPLVLGAEILLGALSYALAVWTVGENRGASWTANVLVATLGIVVLARLAASLSVELYRRSLRYASLADLISIIKVVTASSIGVCALIWWRFPQLKVPAAIFVVDWAFLQLFWGGLHFGARVLKTQQAVSRMGENAW